MAIAKTRTSRENDSIFLPSCLSSAPWADRQLRDAVSGLAPARTFEALTAKRAARPRISTPSDLPDIWPIVTSSGEAGASRKIPPTRSVESPAQRGPIRCPAPEHIHRDAPRARTRRYRAPGLRPESTVRLSERSPRALGTPDLVTVAKHQFHLCTARRAFDQLVENASDTCVSALHVSPDVSRDYPRSVTDLEVMTLLELLDIGRELQTEQVLESSRLAQKPFPLGLKRSVL